VQRATDSKDFAMADGKAIAVTRELGGGSDRVDVVDPATGQPLPEFISASGRIRNFDANGGGTQQPSRMARCGSSTSTASKA
jgi:hypothetical protein